MTGADLTAETVIAGGLGRDVTLTTGSSGDVRVDAVTALGDRIGVNSAGAIEESGDDGEAELIGSVLNLDAVSGIGITGILETEGNSIRADTTDGTIDLTNASSDDVTIFSLTTGTGDILFSQSGGGSLTVALAQSGDGSIGIDVTDGDLDAVVVTADGEGQNVTLSTSNTGDVTFDLVRASDRVTLVSAGGIEGRGVDEETDLIGAVLDLAGVTGIGTAWTIEMEGGSIAADTTDGAIDLANLFPTDVTISSLTTGLGDILFRQSGGGTMKVAVAQTADGSIGIHVTDADLSLVTVVAEGIGRDVALSTANAGNVLVGFVEALDDGITIRSAEAIEEDGVDPEADLAASRVDMEAVTGVGADGTIETACTTIRADTADGMIDLVNVSSPDVTVESLSTGTGDILFTQSGGGSLTVTAVLSDEGNIGMTVYEADLLVGSTVGFDGHLLLEVESGDLIVEEAAAGGTGKNVTLKTFAFGDVIVGDVVALDDTITIISAGAVEEYLMDAGPDLTASTIVIDAMAGIGSQAILETRAETLIADTGEGSVQLANFSENGVTLPSITTGTGNITISQQDGGALNVALAETGDGNIQVHVQEADLIAGTVTAGGEGKSVSLTTEGSGHMVLDEVSAEDDQITLVSSGGMVEEPTDDLDVDLKAAVLVLSAKGTIGGSAGTAIETQAISLEARAETAGGIFIRERNDITLSYLETADGPIHVVSGGTMTVTEALSQTDTDLNDIRLRALTGDVLVGSVKAGGVSGDVSILADQGAIIDNLDGEGANVEADEIVFEAVSGIGSSDDLNVNVRVVEATNKTTGHIRICQLDAAGDLEVSRMRQTGLQGGSILVVVENGRLVVSGPVILMGNGHLLLETRGQAHDIVLEGPLSLAMGNVTVMATEAINQRTAIETMAGSIDVESLAGGITMADGAWSHSHGENIRYRAPGDVTLGGLDAASGQVAVVSAGGSILDGGDWHREVSAASAMLQAVDSVGTFLNGNGALETAVDVVAASAGNGGIHLLDDDDVEIGLVGAIQVTRIRSDLTTTLILQDELGGMVTSGNGSIHQKSFQGDVIVTEPVRGAGEGRVILQSFSGEIRLDNEVTTEAGATAFLRDNLAAFEWTQIDGAMLYYVSLERNGVVYDSAWVDGLTSWSPGYGLVPGDYEMVVQPWLTDSLGPPTQPLAFKVIQKPNAVSLDGIVTAGEGLIFEWTALDEATWYVILVCKDGEPYADQWIEGVTRWVPGWAFPTGGYQWTVQAWNPNGYGLLSAPAQFDVTGMEVSAPVIEGPTGAVPQGEDLVFEWNEIVGATWYHLTIEKEAEPFTTVRVEGATQWMPSQPWTEGLYEWTVKAWSVEGYGMVSEKALFEIQSAITIQRVPMAIPSGSRSFFGQYDLTNNEIRGSKPAPVIILPLPAASNLGIGFGLDKTETDREVSPFESAPFSHVSIGDSFYGLEDTEDPWWSPFSVYDSDGFLGKSQPF